jgi:acyl-homoserine lactone acylase PvdQ
MKLNINSTSAQLYRWFYATEQMPQSLCPYFWKLVLMWVFILPYTILSLPVILMDLKDPDRRTTGERAGVGFFI